MLTQYTVVTIDIVKKTITQHVMPDEVEDCNGIKREEHLLVTSYEFFSDSNLKN